MNENKAKKLSTDAYKGVRDFYPEDMAVQKKIFQIWRNTAEKYGYEEYTASVLEPSDLYRAKTGEEIVDEQTYTFIDRGEREVTLRPEMTPTVARMVAAKRRDLVFPLRWYSIPNLFRYEQPQRGRLREHWQLNVDIFGVDNTNAEVEVISMAYDITKAYGLKDTDFEIRINNRKITNFMLREVFSLSEEVAKKLAKLIDKKDKMKDDFEVAVREVFTANRADIHHSDTVADKFLTLLKSKNFEEFSKNLPETKEEHQGLREIKAVLQGLDKLGIMNARFDQSLMRGFDYYTGTVFEIYDLNPNNRRSVFGGGRYDDLLSLFGNDKVTAVGFGAGDVIARDLMETYSSLPSKSAPADVSVLVVGEQNAPYAMELAQSLRQNGIRVSVDISGKKLGDQISSADKKGITKIIAVGEEEVKTGNLRLKNLSSGEETLVSGDEVSKLLKN